MGGKIQQYVSSRGVNGPHNTVGYYIIIIILHFSFTRFGVGPQVNSSSEGWNICICSTWLRCMTSLSCVVTSLEDADRILWRSSSSYLEGR